MPRRALAVLLLAVAAAGSAGVAAAQTAPQVPPAPARWVTDDTGFLSPDARAALDAKLQAYEQRSGHQVVVWIARGLNGWPLDDFAVRTFAAWGLGRKGQDDGLALFIFSEDRKIAIEVGYGLEDRVPDARAARIISETMAPLLRAGENDRAVAAAVNEILGLIEGRPASELGLPETPATTATPPPPEAERGRGPGDGPSLPQLILYGIIGLIVLVSFIRNPHLMAVLLSGMFRGGGGGWGGGWGGGGGFGGGGGGGFSGGGGRSGGGGARGGW